MFLLHVIVFEILCVILIIISKHRKNKAIKEIVLSSSVKKKLQHFRDSKPPAAFQASERSAKFLEMFHIQVCPLLLEHEKISSAQCRKILDSYSKFLLQAGVEDFDEITLSYHKNIIEIMKIFQEFYC